ncbi:MAG: isoprenylcysteine carboxylmethyltransferase family protein [Gemmatimonadaceae bacterium]
MSDRHSRLIIVPHNVAFGLMYGGIDVVVVHHAGPEGLAGQRILGAIIIVAGAALATWVLIYLRSWRFRATLDAGHELATGGPFRLVRHPISPALDLLAIGTAVWAPTSMLLAAAALMVIGSEVRGQAEEKLLLSAIGDRYRTYTAKTARFVPGLY